MASPSTTSDDSLRTSVLYALRADRRTAALDLRIGVLRAVVHLGGEAASPELRRRVESIAAGVAGVRGVVNRIHAPGAPDPARTIDLPSPKPDRRAR